MRFPGTLHLPNDHGSGITVVLEISNAVVSVQTEDEQLGSWPIDEFEADRATESFFSLILGGEALEFRPADRLRFAYEGLVYIEEEQERLGKRFRGAAKRRNARKQAAAANQQQLLESTAATEAREREATPPIAPSGPAVAETSSTTPRPPPEARVVDMSPEAPAATPTEPANPAEPATDAWTNQSDQDDTGKDPFAQMPDKPERGAEPRRASSTPSEPDRLTPTNKDAAPRSAQEDDVLSPASEPLAESEHAVRTDNPTTQAGRDEAISDADSLTVDLGQTSEQKAAPKKASKRFRRQKVEHVHTYRTAAAGGGMVRRVCDECHHVSIGSE